MWFKRTKRQQVKGEEYCGFLSQAGAVVQQAVIRKFAVDSRL